jgi:hypothetical protein
VSQDIFNEINLKEDDKVINENDETLLDFSSSQFDTIELAEYFKEYNKKYCIRILEELKENLFKHLITFWRKTYD